MTVIVAMTRAHIEALLPYEEEVFGTEAWTASAYRAEIADTTHRYYVAAEDQDGQLLGWAGVMVVGDAAQVLTIGVIPSARGRGIAQRMLDDMLAEARRRGATEAFLEVRVDNIAAQQLYRRNGFTDLRVRRGYYENGRVDGLEMKRAL